MIGGAEASLRELRAEQGKQGKAGQSRAKQGEQALRVNLNAGPKGGGARAAG